MGEVIGTIHTCQQVLGLPITPTPELEALPEAELIALRHRLLSQAIPNGKQGS
jgi:hypothetical protein